MTENVFTERRKVALVLSMLASAIYWYVLVLLTREDGSCGSAWQCNIEYRDRISLCISLFISAMVWLQRCYTIRV
jgi:hypothetical protein